MPDPVSEKNLARYETMNSWHDASPFCLMQVNAYRSDDPSTQQKVVELLDGLTERQTCTTAERSCSIGGCTLKIVEDLERGREVTGQCKAASYCLKTAFEAVGQAPTVEAGRALHREIIATLESGSSKYSAGNFCPKLDCGLSAGVSVDAVPGTAGDCVVERNSCQQTVDFGKQDSYGDTTKM